MAMKISSKLLLSFCFINLLIILSSALVYHQLGRIEGSQDALLAQALPALQRDEASQKALIATVSSLRAYLILGKDPAQVIASSRSGKMPNAIDRQRFTPDLTRALQGFQGGTVTGVGPGSHRREPARPHPDAAGGRPLAESALDQLQSFANEEVATPQATLPGDRRLLLKQVGMPTTAWAMRSPPCRISSSRGEGSTWTSTGTTTSFTSSGWPS